MSKVSLGGSATGTATFDIVAPATNTNRTITLPDTSGQVSVLDLRAAQTASGTSVDFLNIPATARRITVMFNGVSTNGTSPVSIRIGAGSIQSTGYLCSASRLGGASVATVSDTAGFQVRQILAADVSSGAFFITKISGDTWVINGSAATDTTVNMVTNGSVNLSGPLDRLRITTVNGTDTFDAGSISILVE